MIYKSEKAQGLSLTFKEEFDLSKLLRDTIKTSMQRVNADRWDAG